MSFLSALAQAGAYDVRWKWVWLAWCGVAIVGIILFSLLWWARESGVWHGGRHHRGAHA